ncbi:hypothetical protein RvY_17701 [Ramazzottius varieornatus]|uniref:Uncharacterized protein n=1 Tax=Ramazzottius varieornatus TaxID=947166 RepID=A0A1D1W558_RAMVA|nr:hypothetical protein RvY_17701 [Ramazzottius varieornatus]
MVRKCSCSAVAVLKKRAPFVAVYFCCPKTVVKLAFSAFSGRISTFFRLNLRKTTTFSMCSTCISVGRQKLWIFKSSTVQLQFGKQQKIADAVQLQFLETGCNAEAALVSATAVGLYLTARSLDKSSRAS